MARGIGGDDGPSLFMAVACVVLWSSFKSWMKETKDDVNKVAKKNYANILQPETTSEIEQMEARVAAIPVQYSQLPKPRTAYASIAQRQWDEMRSTFNIDEDKLFGEVEKLNANELRAVAKAFGVKEITALGVAAWTGDIFRAYEKHLDDNVISGNEVARMKKIWAKAGIWY